MDPKFSDLAAKSYAPWHMLEGETGLQLVYKTGGIFWSTNSPHFVTTYQEAGRKAGAAVQRLSAADIRRRWPQFTLDDSAEGVFDPEAGLVDAINGNAAHQQCALARGAEIKSNTKVTKLEKLQGEGMKVTTDKGDFTCRKVIVTSGAWINQVLVSCGVQIPVKVTQENVTYFATPHLKEFTKEKFPVFIYMDNRANQGIRDIYALPIHGIPGFKIGLDAEGPETTGESRTFTPDPTREKICKDFLAKYLPNALGRIIETKTCLYTMTYDRTFVIDTLASKEYPDVIVCCGAGHAYKFAALFGKLLSEMAIFGGTNTDIADFTINRPAITDPGYRPNFHPVAQMKNEVNARL